MSDPYESTTPTPTSFGTKGATITPANGTDLDPVAKSIVVTSTSGGTTLQVLPAGNANGSWITFDDVDIGFQPPYRIRRVGESTNCTVASVDG